MQAHELSLKSANFADLNIGMSGLYLLAAPSTPDETRRTCTEPHRRPPSPRATTPAGEVVLPASGLRCLIALLSSAYYRPAMNDRAQMMAVVIEAAERDARARGVSEEELAST